MGSVASAMAPASSRFAPLRFFLLASSLTTSALSFPSFALRSQHPTPGHDKCDGTADVSSSPHARHPVAHSIGSCRVTGEMLPSHACHAPGLYVRVQTRREVGGKAFMPSFFICRGVNASSGAGSTSVGAPGVVSLMHILHVGLCVTGTHHHGGLVGGCMQRGEGGRWRTACSCRASSSCASSSCA